MDNKQESIKRAQELLSVQATQVDLDRELNLPQSRANQLDSLEVNEDLKKRKEEQEISQQDKRFESEMEQRRIDRDLKKAIATLVFRFLAVETAALFLIVLIQGFKPWSYHLEDSTINIFLGATLLQISSMAVIITRHLYPTSQP